MSSPMTQVKFTVEADIVSVFKSRCVAENVSMTSVIRQYMIACHPTKAVKTKPLTRPLRRKAVMEIIGILNTVMESEMEYRDNIPEAFTQRYDDADESCGHLSEAILCLEAAY